MPRNNVSLFLLMLLHMTCCGSSQRTILQDDIYTSAPYTTTSPPQPPNAAPTYPPTSPEPPLEQPPPMRADLNYTLPLLITFQVDFDVIINQRVMFETDLKTGIASVFRVLADDIRINNIYRGSVVVDMHVLSEVDLRQDANVQSFIDKPEVWLSQSFRDNYNITEIAAKFNDKTESSSSGSATRSDKVFFYTMLAVACMVVFGL